MKITIPILVKLGFKKESKCDWCLKKNDFMILVYFDPDWNDVNNGEGGFMFPNGDCMNFRSVEELQNIYCSLTNEAITLN